MAESKPAPASADGASKPKAGRSPSYPNIDLEAALAHLHTLYEKNAKTNHPIAFELAMGHCGFTKKSSSGRLALAALRKYGLIDYIGSGDKRTVVFTDRALDILTDERDSSPDRAKHLVNAALEPEIFKELYKRWNGKLPDEATVKYYLRRDKGYTDSAVPDLISNYQRTIEFAKRQASGNMPSEPLDIGDGDSRPNEEVSMEEQREERPRGGEHARRQAPPPPPLGMKEYPLPLLTADDAVLRVPDGMSEDDWDQMIDVLNVMKRGILAKSRRAAEEATEGDEPN